MDFGSVLSRAAQIAWRYKVLWIFGIMAGCGSANINPGGSSRYSFEQSDIPAVERFFNQLTDAQVALLVIGGILLGILMALLFTAIASMGTIGVVRGTAEAERGAASLTFAGLFSGSQPYFWRVFGLVLLVFFATFVSVVAVLVLGIAGTIATLGVGLVCLVPLICLLVPLSWLVQVLTQQATIAIVLENLSVADGLRRAWELIRREFSSYLVMALILILGVGLIGGLIIGIPFFATLVPGIAGAVSGEGSYITGGMILSLICMVALLPFMLLINGILQTFSISAWTLTYLRLSNKPVPASWMSPPPAQPL